MWKTNLFLLLSFVSCVIMGQGCISDNKSENPEIDFSTFNMFYTPDINAVKSYGGAWSKRKPLIAEIIKENNFDIVASQELTKAQVLDFEKIVGNDYAFVEERLKDINDFDKNILSGRKFPKNDIIELSMHNAIWYKKSRFEVLKKGGFYLSNTPDEFSFGFDKSDGQHRRCAWALFSDKKLGREFFVFNIHTNSMDYEFDTEREKSARVIIEQVLKISNGKPFILCGDFNAFDRHASVKAYVTNGNFFDARTYSKTSVQGVNNSYHQFGKYDADPNYDRIDYIFLSKDFLPLDYRVIDGKRNGMYPSDHYPVCSRLILKK